MKKEIYYCDICNKQYVNPLQSFGRYHVCSTCQNRCIVEGIENKTIKLYCRSCNNSGKITTREWNGVETDSVTVKCSHCSG